MTKTHPTVGELDQADRISDVRDDVRKWGHHLGRLIPASSMGGAIGFCECGYKLQSSKTSAEITNQHLAHLDAVASLLDDDGRRCRDLECDDRSHDHLDPTQLFCHEWLPYPSDLDREVCSICKSVFVQANDGITQKTLDDRRDRIERRAKLSGDLREAIRAYLSEYGVEEPFASGTSSDVVDETLGDVIDEYGDGS